MLNRRQRVMGKSIEDRVMLKSIEDIEDIEDIGGHMPDTSMQHIRRRVFFCVRYAF